MKIREMDSFFLLGCLVLMFVVAGSAWYRSAGATELGRHFTLRLHTAQFDGTLSCINQGAIVDCTEIR